MKISLWSLQLFVETVTNKSQSAEQAAPAALSIDNRWCMLIHWPTREDHRRNLHTYLQARSYKNIPDVAVMIPNDRGSRTLGSRLIPNASTLSQ